MNESPPPKKQNMLSMCSLSLYSVTLTSKRRILLCLFTKMYRKYSLLRMRRIIEIPHWKCAQLVLNITMSVSIAANVCQHQCHQGGGFKNITIFKIGFSKEKEIIARGRIAPAFTNQHQQHGQVSVFKRTGTKKDWLCGCANSQRL